MVSEYKIRLSINCYAEREIIMLSELSETSFWLLSFVFLFCLTMMEYFR